MVHPALCFDLNLLQFSCWKHIFDLIIYHNFGIDSFWKHMLLLSELLTVITKELYKNINWLMFLCIHLLMMVAGEKQYGKYCVVLSEKCYNTNMNALQDFMFSKIK
jgi:hypothetical protein